MRLDGVSTLRLEEVHALMTCIPILEDGEGPKWGFKYDNFKNDPTPEILLLGAYQHPNTGNHLVGGINLHYLNNGEITALARVLPDIMKAGNLYQRYWTGKRVVPDIFTKNYRTYNSDYIRGVTPSTMYPKFGFLQTTKNWFKDKVGGIFKSKKQKEKEAQPQYPQDLANMQDQIRLVVTNLQRRAEQQAAQPQQQEPVDTPEMRRAREAFQAFQREKIRREIGMDPADDQLQQSYDDYLSNLNQGRIEHPDQAQQTAQQQPEQPQDNIRPQRPPKVNMRRAFEQDREENQEELTDPDNEVQLGESITYYSPKHKRYITESFVLSKC